MAEVVDTTVGGTQQPGNCESLQEHGPEDKRFGGAASTTTTQLAETSDCRKRPGGSSPSKARIYFPLYIWFALEVIMFILNGLLGLDNHVVQFRW